MELLGGKTPAQPQAAQIGQIIIEQVKKEAERTAEQTVVDAKEDEFDASSAQVQAYIGEQLAVRDDLSEVAQKELAATVRLLGDISTTDKPWVRKNLQLLGSIDTAVRAILKEPPQLEYAKATRKHIHRRVHPIIGAGLWESLKRSMKASPAAVVVVGLAITFVLLTFVPLLSRDLDLSSVTIGEFLRINPSVLLLVGTVGALGSIASIMLRIRDSAFESYTTSSDPWPWLFFGLFKPVVGALFALFVFAVLRSSLLPVEVAGQTEGWFVMVLPFVAGFSERFAPTIVSNAEGVFVGNTLPPPPATTSSTPPPRVDDVAAGNGNPANGGEAEPRRTVGD